MQAASTVNCTFRTLHDVMEITSGKQSQNSALHGEQLNAVARQMNFWYIILERSSELQTPF
jgi:hypothetical protein